MSRSHLDRAYELLAEEGEQRISRDLPEAAGPVVPRNFFTQLTTQGLTKLGDQISSPKVVLPWLFSVLAVPTGWVALLVPIREAGALLPQLTTATLLRGQPRHAPFWIAGSIMQGLATLGMAAVALFLDGIVAGLSILGLLALFSLARGVCSVVSKNVVGKTIPKTRRGRLGGWSASVAGLLAIATGLFLRSLREGGQDPRVLAGLLAVAGLCWLVAAAIYTRVLETPGSIDSGASFVDGLRENFALLRTERGLARFVVARALLTSTALSAPFYVLIARDQLGGTGQTLGLLVVAQGLAGATSSYAWGRSSDRSSRRVLVVAALLATALAMIVFFAQRAVDLPAWAMVAAVYALGVVHSGVRLGRKTYVVDLATADTRGAYVALSNTLIGIVLLPAGALTGWMASALPSAEVILVLGLVSLVGGLVAMSLPEAE